MTPEARKLLKNESQRFQERYRESRQRNQKSEANILLEIHLKELGISFQPEFQFLDTRKWRFDYLLQNKVAVEIEGGIWINGRHTRAKGYQNDLEKYREATRLGYKVYRFSTQEVLNGTAREFLKGECEWKTNASF